MRYSINLATRICLDHRLINRTAYCMVALLVVVACWNFYQVFSNIGAQSRLNAEITTHKSKYGTKPSGVSDVDVNNQKSRIRFYNEIIDRKSTNWLAILELFENVTPEGVTLSRLSPDSKSNEFKLDGRARSFKAVQQYLEKLDSSKSFTDILLLSHKNVVETDKPSGVEFSISCKVLHR